MPLVTTRLSTRCLERLMLEKAVHQLPESNKVARFLDGIRDGTEGAGK